MISSWDNHLKNWKEHKDPRRYCHSEIVMPEHTMPVPDEDELAYNLDREERIRGDEFRTSEEYRMEISSED